MRWADGVACQVWLDDRWESLVKLTTHHIELQGINQQTSWVSTAVCMLVGCRAAPCDSSHECAYRLALYTASLCLQDLSF